MNKIILAIAALCLLASAALAADAPNALKMEGASPTFDLNVNYGDNFAQYKQVGTGLYDVVVYFDPSGVETLIPAVNEALRIGDLETFNFDEVRVWLGNLTDPGQNKSMPMGVVDMANKRVLFHNVKLAPGTMIRWNLPCKFYKQGKEVVLNNTAGPLGKGYGWGWLPDNGCAVTGTVNNGQRIFVEPDGALMPKPHKTDKPTS